MADLPKNQFKAALKSGDLQRGIWCTMSDPLATEMVATLEYDWMMFDTEHSPMDAISLLPLLQAVARFPVSPIVRPSSLNPAEIKKLLDLGVQTLLVPMIQNAQEAKQAVAAVTYPPSGIRGVSGLTRATNFATVPNYHKRAREEIALILQIESMEAVDEIEAIAAVEGVDAIFVGPADLAASLGVPGEASHPKVQEACEAAVKRIVAAGKPAGFMSADEAFVDRIIKAGATFISRDIDLAALKRGLVSRL